MYVKITLVPDGTVDTLEGFESEKEEREHS
jgi:hypothetical protein